MSKFLGVVAATLIGLAVAQAQERPATLDPGEKALQQCERALYDAVAKNDKVAFQGLVLPEGTWASPTGFIPMGMLADSLDVYRLPSAFGGQNLRVVWTDANKDSALVLYGRTGGGSFGHGFIAETVLVATAWTKRNGKWFAVHHHESDVAKQ
jgi:hypothetical protein